MAKGVQRLEVPKLNARKETIMGLTLLLILGLLLLGSLPKWGYSRNWRYSPSNILTLAIVVVVVLLSLGYIRFGF